MSEIKIYHNPGCTSSTNVVEILEEQGKEFETILYLKTKPQKDELENLIGMLLDPPTELVRRDKFFKDQNFSDADVNTPKKVVDMLVKHPRLLQRPIIVVGNKAIVGRPKEKVLELL